jgi:hypothetical protein
VERRTFPVSRRVSATLDLMSALPTYAFATPVERLDSSAGAPRVDVDMVDMARRARLLRGCSSARGWDQVCDSTLSTTGHAPPIVVEMTVAVVPRTGWWLDQNETPASAPDMVIRGESAFSQKPRP